jgi:hypothetical protein
MHAINRYIDYVTKMCGKFQFASILIDNKFILDKIIIKLSLYLINRFTDFVEIRYGKLLLIYISLFSLHVNLINLKILSW